MSTIIQLSGLARSGKDHTALQLKSILESQGKTVSTLSYAAPMKRIISTIFGISLEVLDIYKNSPEDIVIDTVDSNANPIGVVADSTDFRTILQLFGNEAMKAEFGPNVWADLMHTNIQASKADVIIIPDCRFLAEINTVGGTIVRIKNDDIKNTSSHASETELDSYEFDYILDNTGYSLTKDSLQNFVKELNAKER